MFLIGVGLIVVSWIAINHASIALVGQLYFTGSAVSIGLSAVGGVLVDRQSRRSMILRSQSLRVIAACTLLAGLQDEAWLTPGLFSFTILSAAGPAISVGAMGGAFQSFFPADKRMNIILRLSIVGQAGFILGTGASGLMLHLWDAQTCVMIFIAISIGLLLLGEYFTRGMSQAPERTRVSFSEDWRAGLRYAFETRQIFPLMMGVALLFSVAQMTNTLVPGFVRDTLHAGSDVFGLLEAAWSAGGGLILAVSATLQRRAYKSWFEFLLLALLGMTMIGFSLSQWVSLSVIIYAIMGGLFSLSRALCNGRLLMLTDPAQIGRTQALSAMLTSAMGMAVYLLPTLVTINDISLYYRAWGIAIIALGLGLAAMTSRTGHRARIVRTTPTMHER